MRKKGRGHFWWWLSLFLVAGAAALIGYYWGVETGSYKKDVIVEKKLPDNENVAPRIARAIPLNNESNVLEEKTPEDEKDYCARIEEEVLEYFGYLNKKDYIQHLEAGIDTHDRFRKLIRKLTASPPIPAGEGVDTKIIAKNIFHLFRLLDRNDLRLIREILRNEADTLEMNLDLFYRWLMLENRCSEGEETRPSLEELYHYAGFFVNSIGGRAYLFRRSLGVRLLISYYCTLIIHEADKRGQNSYGIDIFPKIAPLTREMSIYPDFNYQTDYILQLAKLQNYYLKKRE